MEAVKKTAADLIPVGTWVRHIPGTTCTDPKYVGKILRYMSNGSMVVHCPYYGERATSYTGAHRFERLELEEAFLLELGT
mgnify:CR=1 FL=1